MSRPFALAVFAIVAAVPVHAADPTPEQLLSPTAQLYVRWDGIAAHTEAYKKSIWGPVMAGPTGESIRALVAKAPKLLGNSLLAEPLLDGKEPTVLKANLADLKNASKLIDLVADRGIVLIAEVREPTPTLKGIVEAIGGLLGGKAPEPEAIMPDVHVVVIVPDVGDKAEVLFSTIRLLMPPAENTIEPLAVAGRKGFRFVPDEQNRGPTLPLLVIRGHDTPVPVHAAWWVEGPHFVFYIGTTKPESIVLEMMANGKKGGITGHPLYQRVRKDPGYESITRGFIDTDRMVTLAKNIAGPFVPGLAQRLDDIGLGNLKAVAFNSGFDGKESRATYEFDLPGERKGLAKVLKGGTPLGVNDLPPMPPDVSRFSALRLDAAATYEAGIALIELLTLNDQYGVEDAANTPAETIRLRREYLMREADKTLGVSVKDDILPALGDKLVVFQSPTEGLSAFGTVVCASLKDPAKAKATADQINHGIEALAGTTIKIRKKVYRGVEIRELYSRGFGVITPSYAIVGDWLVIAANPQPIQGLILRHKGELEKWAPDAATTARLAKMPTDGCGLQYCNPKSTAQNLCCIGPLFVGLTSFMGRFNETESDFDPFDVGLIPNGHELSRHLFPNLTVTRDDGKTVRIEVNESFSLPLEIIGFEALSFGLSILGLGL